MRTFVEKYGSGAVDFLTDASEKHEEIEAMVIPRDGDWDNMDDPANLAVTHACCFLAFLGGERCDHGDAR